MIDSLVGMVAKAPKRPIEFREHQLQMIKSRLAQGEGATMVASSFGVEPDQIRAIGVEAGIHVHP
jgi:hypothetical protein